VPATSLRLGPPNLRFESGAARRTEQVPTTQESAGPPRPHGQMLQARPSPSSAAFGRLRSASGSLTAATPASPRDNCKFVVPSARLVLVPLRRHQDLMYVVGTGLPKEIFFTGRKVQRQKSLVSGRSTASSPTPSSTPFPTTISPSARTRRDHATAPSATSMSLTDSTASPTIVRTTALVEGIASPRPPADYIEGPAPPS